MFPCRGFNAANLHEINARCTGEKQEHKDLVEPLTFPAAPRLYLFFCKQISDGLSLYLVKTCALCFGVQPLQL